MQRLHIGGGLVRDLLRAEHADRHFEQLLALFRDLIGMQVIVLGKFFQRLLALDRGKPTFALKPRCGCAGLV